MESEEENRNFFTEGSDIKLIDFLNEDDILVDHRFRDSLEDLRLSVTFKDLSEHAKSFIRANQLEKANTESIQHQKEEKLLDSGSFKPRSTDPFQEKITGGVLDLKGLPAIKEEFKGKEEVTPKDRSVDTDFTFETFDGDAFSLECLENDIFDDVRASIYRSCGTPEFSSASRDSVMRKTGAPNDLSSKKINVSSQKTKNSSANSRVQLPTLRKSKEITVSSLHPKNNQHVKGGYDATPTGQTKRASSGYGKVQNRKTGEGLMMHKLSASVDSPGFKNFLTPPTKSSYSSRAATKSPSLVRSSCDQFSSTFSSKSLSNHGTRHTGTKSSKIASSGSLSKPPLGYSGRRILSNQTSSIRPLSMSRQFNSSPTSSIDRWSLQSSSSTVRATAKLRSGNLEGKFKTETNKATGLHRFTPTKMSPDQHSKGAPEEVSPVSVETPKGFKRSGLRMPSPKHGFFDEVSKSLSSLGETPKSSKPSGLRMPSPRHGFFDEEKFTVRSTLDSVQFRLSSPNAFSDPSAFIRGYVPENRKVIGSPLTQSLHCTSSIWPQHSLTSKEVNDISTPSTGKRSSLKTEEKRNKSMLIDKTGQEGKDLKGRNGNLLDTMKAANKDQETAREVLLESDQGLLCESKENFEDQVKNLNIYFEVIDVAENAIQLDGQKSSATQDEPLGGEHFPRGQQQDSSSITPNPICGSTNISW